jgi:naphthalene 1,2-dioxygenase system ferredoxin subunit
MDLDDCFTLVAQTTDVPAGGLLKVSREGEDLVLYNLGGEIYAIQEMCTHGDASLADGLVADDEIECPLHGACFSVKTGEVLVGPAEQPLKTFPVRILGDAIFVGPAEQ